MTPTPAHPDDASAVDASASGRTEGVVTIPRVEETVAIGTRTVVTGGVTVDKRVGYEEETLHLRTVDRGYEVERRAVNEVLDAAPAAVEHLPDGSVVYRVVREVPVVVTRYELVEEVVLRPSVAVTEQPTVIPRRVERIEVTRAAAARI